MGSDAQAVGRLVRQLRRQGVRVAGFVGEEEALAREMAVEMLGGLDEVVVAGPAPAPGGAPTS